MDQLCVEGSTSILCQKIVDSSLKSSLIKDLLDIYDFSSETNLLSYLFLAHSVHSNYSSRWLGKENFGSTQIGIHSLLPALLQNKKAKKIKKTFRSFSSFDSPGWKLDYLVTSGYWFRGTVSYKDASPRGVQRISK